jgi:hypothetical protein
MRKIDCQECAAHPAPGFATLMSRFKKLIGLGRMERAMGIEPTTSSLGSWHSTAELRPLRQQ